MAGYRRALLLAFLAGMLMVYADRAAAQFGPMIPRGRYELSDTVQLDQVDTNVVKHLDRVKALMADKQWNEVIDTLTQVMDGSGGKLIGVTDRRYISVRDYCHLQLASLPPDALKLYRDRVDAQAKKLYDEGIAQRDSRRLLEVLDRAFASNWGDKALKALGEMALESGDYAAARAYWEKIIPVQPPENASRTWLSVPSTDLDLAGIRARLVLTSILEGSSGRAKDELAKFAKLHPDAKGRLGGREVNYATALTTLLNESAQWPKPKVSPDWPTFAGSMLRNKTGPKLIDVGDVAWRVPLRPSLVPSGPAWGVPPPTHRVAEDAKSPLSYHPVVVGNLLLVNNLVEILAIDLRTGKPAWEHDRPVIYEDQFDEEVRKFYVPADSLGVPRFTMTVLGSRLYARMGPAPTSWAREFSKARGSGYLVCLDLSAEGRLVWKISAEEGWAFEGSPVADEANIYVAMRRSDIQPHVFVACFDAQTGQLRWRQSVCAAESPARGMVSEITSSLLTLHRDTLYLNTNLGAVAALAARDGRLLWVSLYPRVTAGDLAKPEPHTNRDLNPCLYDRGVLLVAPADSRRVFALEAATGQLLWQTGPQTEDIVHLLSVTGDTLIASGEKLYWISLKEGEQGRVKRVWPDGHEKMGYGRGLLAGDCILWPTREKIYLFDQDSGTLKKEVSLVPRGITGGSLLVADGRLLIAMPNALVAFNTESHAPPKPGGRVNPVMIGEMEGSGDRGQGSGNGVQGSGFRVQDFAASWMGVGSEIPKSYPERWLLNSVLDSASSLSTWSDSSPGVLNPEP